jgi:hypothetical protein
MEFGNHVCLSTFGGEWPVVARRRSTASPKVSNGKQSAFWAMRTEFPAVAAALLLATGLSGCVELSNIRGDDEVGITVPSLRFGDSWTMAAIDEARHAPRWETAYTTHVASAPDEMLDRFGNPVDAVALKGDLVQAAVPYSSTQWIELGGGNLLKTSGSSSLVKGSCFYSAAPMMSGQTSELRFINDSYYPTHAVPASFLQPWGKTLRSGQPLMESATVDYWFGAAKVEATYKVLGKAQIQPAAYGNGTPLSVVVVEQRLSNGGVGAPEETGVYQWFLAPGIPVPVRVQLAPRDSHRSAGSILSELVEFHPGARPITTRPGAGAGSFEPVNPIATLGRFAPSPPMGGLYLEYPLKDALLAVQRDPRAASAILWMRDHPNAVITDAIYTKDVARGVFDWSLALRDSTQTMTVSSSRRTVGGVALDQASLSTTYTSGGGPPARVGDQLVTDLGTALKVSMAFKPELQQWRRLSWHAMREPGSDAWRIATTFATARTETRPGPAPWVETEVVHFDEGPMIDGRTGGLGDVWFRMGQCDSHLVLRSPV